LKNWFWFVCGAIVTVGYLFVVIQASTTARSRQPAITQQHIVTEPGEEVKLAVERSLARYTLWLAIFTAVLAISTIGLWFTAVWSGRKQFRQTQDSIALTRDEFLSTHRPKIRVKHVVLSTPLWQGERLAVKVVLVNNGTTDAFIAEWGCKFIIQEKGRMLPALPEIARRETPRITEGKLSPGISLELSDVSDGTVLTDDDNTGIRKRSCELFCLGYVHYLDSVRRVRTTAFCRVLNFPQFPKTHEDTGRFRVCPDSDYEYED